MADGAILMAGDSPDLLSDGEAGLAISPTAVKPAARISVRQFRPKLRTRTQARVRLTATQGQCLLCQLGRGRVVPLGISAALRSKEAYYDSPTIAGATDCRL